MPCGACRRQRNAAGTDWALGVQARSRALLSEGESAERAVPRGHRAAQPNPCPRGAGPRHLLYGEWLRRENRRMDAREQLRTAYEMLTAMGIEGFAERARRELLATGRDHAQAHRRAADELTPRRRRSPGSPVMGVRTRRSAPSCSLARAPSSGTCTRCSPSSASAPAKNFAGSPPTPAGWPCRPNRPDALTAGPGREECGSEEQLGP